MKRINTMEQLSTEIGVSRSTLSKYFQDPELVRQSTANKISELLKTVDYVPNFMARNMRRKHTGLFGVVLPHLNDLFFMALLRQIERRADELDFRVLVQNSHGDPDKELAAVRVLLSMNAEGAIIAPIGTRHDAAEFERMSEKLPLVFVDARCPGLESAFSFVGNDNRQSVGQMVDYLRRSGSPPKFLGMPSVNSNSKDRELAYRRRMQEVGLTPEVLEVTGSSSNWDFESLGYEAVKELIDRGIESDATILCANDRLAIGALRAANEAGLMSRRDTGAPHLRIAGHDDHPLSQFVWPAMTTIMQDIERIGRTAVDCVVRHARDETPEARRPVEHLFPARLCIRDSA